MVSVIHHETSSPRPGECWATNAPCNQSGRTTAARENELRDLHHDAIPVSALSGVRLEMGRVLVLPRNRGLTEARRIYSLLAHASAGRG